MLTIRIAAVAHCVMMLCPAAAAELKTPEPVPGAVQYTIRSEKLGESRKVLVYLPDTYSGETAHSTRYPALYLLDGHAYFDATVGIVHHLGSPNAAVQRIPDHIVVAIVNTKRPRDMTPTKMAEGPYSVGSGGAAAFRDFLRTELLPAVDATFRTSTQRVLVGHSLAGLFVIDTFTEQPDMFDAYIAVDPSAWWDDNLPARKLATAHIDSTRPLFIAQARADDPNDSHTVGIARLLSELGKTKKRVRTCYHYFADETHFSVPLQGIYRGLLFVYADDKSQECPSSGMPGG